MVNTLFNRAFGGIDLLFYPRGRKLPGHKKVGLKNPIFITPPKIDPDFLKYVKYERINFVNEIKAQKIGSNLTVSAESFLIAFDLAIKKYREACNV